MLPLYCHISQQVRKRVLNRRLILLFALSLSTPKFLFLHAYIYMYIFYIVDFHIVYCRLGLCIFVLFLHFVNILVDGAKSLTEVTGEAIQKET